MYIYMYIYIYVYTLKYSPHANSVPKDTLFALPLTSFRAIFLSDMYQTKKHGKRHTGYVGSPNIPVRLNQIRESEVRVILMGGWGVHWETCRETLCGNIALFS